MSAFPPCPACGRPLEPTWFDQCASCWLLTFAPPLGDLRPARRAVAPDLGPSASIVAAPAARSPTHYRAGAPPAPVVVRLAPSSCVLPLVVAAVFGLPLALGGLGAALFTLVDLLDSGDEWALHLVTTALGWGIAGVGLWLGGSILLGAAEYVSGALSLHLDAATLRVEATRFALARRVTALERAAVEGVRLRPWQRGATQVLLVMRGGGAIVLSHHVTEGEADAFARALERALEGAAEADVTALRSARP
ncbi:MAG: hypothetical protein U0324_18805 [Polyangiales bacterium]